LQVENGRMRSYDEVFTGTFRDAQAASGRIPGESGVRSMAAEHQPTFSAQ
jgi:hypothetical protein